MNKDDKLEILKQVLSMTLEMQDKVQSESWDELVGLEQHRQTLLDAVFPIDSFDGELRALIKQILDLNNVIEAQCTKVKGELQQQLTGMNKNKRAMTAYLI